MTLYASFTLFQTPLLFQGGKSKNNLILLRFSNINPGRTCNMEIIDKIGKQTKDCDYKVTFSSRKKGSRHLTLKWDTVIIVFTELRTY